MTQHKWAKEIKAWADGAEIEQIYTYVNSIFDCWEQVKYPCWYEDDAQFRIKSQPKEPQYLYVYRMAGQHNVEFRFWDTKTDAPTYVGKIKLEVDDD
jgi:hypothetical protein